MNITLNQKFFRFSCLAISFLFYCQLAIARGRVNFVLGKVYVKHGSVKKPVKRGMLIPDKALIITGKRSRVSIYNYKSRNLVTIKPNMKVIWNHFGKKTSSNRMFDKILRNSLVKNRSFTTVAGARGEEEGKTKIDWDEDDTANNNQPDRTKEWRLYQKGAYSKVLTMTKNSRDDGGIFLQAMSIYMLYGAEKEREILDGLSHIETKGSDKFLKKESRRMIGLINFEVGKYPESVESLNKYIRFKHNREISDLVYFMLIKAHKNLGNDAKARDYHRKLKKYHPGSKLLGRVGRI